VKDFLGRELAVGDVVAFEGVNGGGLVLGRIEKFTPKQASMTPLTDHNSWNWRKTITRYSSQCVKVDSADVTMFLLTKAQES
jgi:hypothetical protein